MFTADSETSNANYINTSIYAHHRIVSNAGLRTTKNSSTITMLNHTITGSTTSNGYTSSYSITGDNLYTLLQQLLGRVADALNYAKAAYAYADSAYTYAGQAYTYAGQAYAVGNHSHPYASSSHIHTIGYTKTVVPTSSGVANVVNDLGIYAYSANTSGPQ